MAIFSPRNALPYERLVLLFLFWYRPTYKLHCSVMHEIDSPDDLELQDMYDQLPALRDAVIENHNSGRGNRLFETISH